MHRGPESFNGVRVRGGEREGSFNANGRPGSARSVTKEVDKVGSAS
jgi:hypothetical protein